MDNQTASCTVTRTLPRPPRSARNPGFFPETSAQQGGHPAARRAPQVSARGRWTRLHRSSPDPTRGGGTPVTGRGGGLRRDCGGGERDRRAAEPHRQPRAPEHAPGGWVGNATARVGSPRGPELGEPGEPGIRGQGRRRAPRLPAPGGGGSRAVTCSGSGGGGGSRGGEGASFRKGWDLPARPLPPQRGPSPTYSGVPVAGPRVDGGAPRSRLVPLPPPPGPPVPHSHPGLRLRADGPIASFLSQGGRVCPALLTQQKAGRNPGSSACWLFIPDLL